MLHKGDCTTIATVPLPNKAKSYLLLWAARFFKTRSLAARACELGRIQAHNQAVKPARDVHIGELLQIKTEGGDFEVEVLLLSEVRGPASVAQTLYRETEASCELRAKMAAERRAGIAFNPAPEGRPSKRGAVVLCREVSW